MAGIELAQAFWEEHGKPMLKEKFPQYIDRIAVGLVGHGSECFGFDDEVSQDHDFDAGFCLWITDEDEREFGFKLFRAYSKLPQEFRGIKLQKSSALGSGAKGVHTISEFYRTYTGYSGAPETWQDWLYTPSYYFAEATNGKVFADPLGEFTRIRNEILNGMPEDVRLKKIASKAIAMAQSGQYNFKRCLQHGDRGAAMLALARFAEQGAEMLFLLNRAHAPYYKWLLRAAERLPILGKETLVLRTLLTDSQISDENKINLVEDFCFNIEKELVNQSLSPALGDYLEPYAFAVNDRIKNSEIRNLHIMQD